MSTLKRYWQPRKWKSPEEMKEQMEKYLKETSLGNYSVTGLCLAMNCTKDTLIEYGKKEEFRDIVKIGKLWVEHSYEMALKENGKAGDIFALKNFGWTDKQELSHSGSIGVSLSNIVKEVESE